MTGLISPKNSNIPGITQIRHVRTISVNSFRKKARNPVIAPPAPDQFHEHVLETCLLHLETPKRRAGRRDRRRDFPLRRFQVADRHA